MHRTALTLALSVFLLASMIARAEHGGAAGGHGQINCDADFVIKKEQSDCRADSFLIAHLAHALNCAPGSRFVESFAAFVKEADGELLGLRVGEGQTRAVDLVELVEGLKVSVPTLLHQSPETRRELALWLADRKVQDCKAAPMRYGANPLKYLPMAAHNLRKSASGELAELFLGHGDPSQLFCKRVLGMDGNTTLSWNRDLAGKVKASEAGTDRQKIANLYLELANLLADYKETDEFWKKAKRVCHGGDDIPADAELKAAAQALCDHQKFITKVKKDSGPSLTVASQLRARGLALQANRPIVGLSAKTEDGLRYLGTTGAVPRAEYAPYLASHALYSDLFGLPNQSAIEHAQRLAFNGRLPDPRLADSIAADGFAGNLDSVARAFALLTDNHESAAKTIEALAPYLRKANPQRLAALQSYPGNQPLPAAEAKALAEELRAKLIAPIDVAKLIVAIKQNQESLSPQTALLLDTLLPAPAGTIPAPRIFAALFWRKWGYQVSGKPGALLGELLTQSRYQKTFAGLTVDERETLHGWIRDSYGADPEKDEALALLLGLTDAHGLPPAAELLTRLNLPAPGAPWRADIAGAWLKAEKEAFKSSTKEQRDLVAKMGPLTAPVRAALWKLSPPFLGYLAHPTEPEAKKLIAGADALAITDQLLRRKSSDDYLSAIAAPKQDSDWLRNSLRSGNWRSGHRFETHSHVIGQLQEAQRERPPTVETQARIKALQYFARQLGVTDEPMVFGSERTVEIKNAKQLAHYFQSTLGAHALGKPVPDPVLHAEYSPDELRDLMKLVDSAAGDGPLHIGGLEIPRNVWCYPQLRAQIEKVRAALPAYSAATVGAGKIAPPGFFSLPVKATPAEICSITDHNAALIAERLGWLAQTTGSIPISMVKKSEVPALLQFYYPGKSVEQFLELKPQNYDQGVYHAEREKLTALYLRAYRDYLAQATARVKTPAEASCSLEAALLSDRVQGLKEPSDLFWMRWAKAMHGTDSVSFLVGGVPSIRDPKTPPKDLERYRQTLLEAEGGDSGVQAARGLLLQYLDHRLSEDKYPAPTLTLDSHGARQTLQAERTAWHALPRENREVLRQIFSAPDSKWRLPSEARMKHLYSLSTPALQVLAINPTVRPIGYEYFLFENVISDIGYFDSFKGRYFSPLVQSLPSLGCELPRLPFAERNAIDLSAEERGVVDAALVTALGEASGKCQKALELLRASLADAALEPLREIFPKATPKQLRELASDLTSIERRKLQELAKDHPQIFAKLAAGLFADEGEGKPPVNDQARRGKRALLIAAAYQEAKPKFAAYLDSTTVETDPAAPLIKKWVEHARNGAAGLPTEVTDGSEALARAQAFAKFVQSPPSGFNLAHPEESTGDALAAWHNALNEARALTAQALRREVAAKLLNEMSHDQRAQAVNDPRILALIPRGEIAEAGAAAERQHFIYQHLYDCVQSLEKPREAKEAEKQIRALESEAEILARDGADPARIAAVREQAEFLQAHLDSELRLPDSRVTLRSIAHWSRVEEMRKAVRGLRAVRQAVNDQTAGLRLRKYEIGVKLLMLEGYNKQLAKQREEFASDGKLDGEVRKAMNARLDRRVAANAQREAELRAQRTELDKQISAITDRGDVARAEAALEDLIKRSHAQTDAEILSVRGSAIPMHFEAWGDRCLDHLASRGPLPPGLDGQALGRALREFGAKRENLQDWVDATTRDTARTELAQLAQPSLGVLIDPRLPHPIETMRQAGPSYDDMQWRLEGQLRADFGIAVDAQHRVDWKSVKLHQLDAAKLLALRTLLRKFHDVSPYREQFSDPWQEFKEAVLNRDTDTFRLGKFALTGEGFHNEHSLITVLPGFREHFDGPDDYRYLKFEDAAVANKQLATANQEVEDKTAALARVRTGATQYIGEFTNLGTFLSSKTYLEWQNKYVAAQADLYAARVPGMPEGHFALTDKIQQRTARDWLDKDDDADFKSINSHLEQKKEQYLKEIAVMELVTLGFGKIFAPLKVGGYAARLLTLADHTARSYRFANRINIGNDAIGSQVFGWKASQVDELRKNGYKLGHLFAMAGPLGQWSTSALRYGAVPEVAAEAIGGIGAFGVVSFGQDIYGGQSVKQAFHNGLWNAANGIPYHRVVGGVLPRSQYLRNHPGVQAALSTGVGQGLSASVTGLVGVAKFEFDGQAREALQQQNVKTHWGAFNHAWQNNVAFDFATGHGTIPHVKAVSIRSKILNERGVTVESLRKQHGYTDAEIRAALGGLKLDEVNNLARLHSAEKPNEFAQALARMNGYQDVGQYVAALEKKAKGTDYVADAFRAEIIDERLKALADVGDIRGILENPLFRSEDGKSIRPEVFEHLPADKLNLGEHGALLAQAGKFYGIKPEALAARWVKDPPVKGQSLSQWLRNRKPRAKPESAPARSEDDALLAEAESALPEGPWKLRANPAEAFQRVKDAEKVLGHTLKPEQAEAVLTAHEIGEGELGADGVHPAGIFPDGRTNYTGAQLFAKGRALLRNKLFSPEQAKALLDRGICGRALAASESPGFSRADLAIATQRFLTETEGLFAHEAATNADPASTLEAWRNLDAVARELQRHGSLDNVTEGRLQALEQKAIKLAEKLKVHLRRDVVEIYRVAGPFQRLELPERLRALAAAPGVNGEIKAPDRPKGAVRVRTKLGYEPNADLDMVLGDRVLDYSRGMVVVDSLAAQQAAVKAIQERYDGKNGGAKIVDSRDYTASPHTNGYRAVHYLIQEPNGLVWELQVRLRGVNQVSETIGHKTYEAIRELKDRAKRENRDLNAAEKAEIARQTQLASEAYRLAWEKYAHTPNRPPVLAGAPMPPPAAPRPPTAPKAEAYDPSARPVSPDDALRALHEAHEDPLWQAFVAADQQAQGARASWQKTLAEATAAGKKPSAEERTQHYLRLSRALTARAEAKRALEAAKHGLLTTDPNAWIRASEHPDLTKQIDAMAEVSSQLKHAEEAATAKYNQAKKAYEASYRPGQIPGLELAALQTAQAELQDIIARNDAHQEKIGYLRFVRDIGPQLKSGRVKIVSIMNQEEFHEVRGDDKKGVQEFADNLPVVILEVTGVGEVRAVRTWSEAVDKDHPTPVGRNGGYWALDEPTGREERMPSSDNLSYTMATPTGDNINHHNRMVTVALPAGAVFAIGVTGPVRPRARLIPGTNLVDLTSVVTTQDASYTYLQPGTAGAPGGRQQVTFLRNLKREIPAGSAYANPHYAWPQRRIGGTPGVAEPWKATADGGVDLGVAEVPLPPGQQKPKPGFVLKEQHVVRDQVLPQLPDKTVLPARVRRALLDGISAEARKAFNELRVLNPDFYQGEGSNWKNYPDAYAKRYQQLTTRFSQLTLEVVAEIKKLPKAQQEPLFATLYTDLDGHWMELLHIAPPGVRANPPPTPKALKDLVMQEWHESQK